jgi:hypothetical protein
MENSAEIKEVKNLFKSLFLNRRNLSRAQLSFCESAQHQFKKSKQLSDKQVSILREIKKFLPGQDARVVSNFQ